jgi:hypothetical protein
MREIDKDVAREEASLRRTHLSVPVIERDALALAQLTPASGWGVLPDPATVTLKWAGRNFTKAEMEARLRRAYRQLVGTRHGDETHQQWADRISAMGGYPGVLLHTMRVAYLNLEALS